MKHLASMLSESILREGRMAGIAGNGVMEWWSGGVMGYKGYRVTWLHADAVMREPPTPRAANGKWQMADGRWQIFMLEFLNLGAEGVIGIGGPWRRPRVRRAGAGRVLRLWRRTSGDLCQRARGPGRAV